MPKNETSLTSAVFDQLQQAMAADVDGFVELYRDYLVDAWQSIQSLRDNLSQHQAALMQAKAHYLKSSSLVLGASTVAEGASLLEQAAIAGNFSGAEEVLEKTGQALREVQSELAERLGARVVPANQTAA